MMRQMPKKSKEANIGQGGTGICQEDAHDKHDCFHLRRNGVVWIATKKRDQKREKICSEKKEETTQRRYLLATHHVKEQPRQHEEECYGHTEYVHHVGNDEPLRWTARWRLWCHRGRSVVIDIRVRSGVCTGITEEASFAEQAIVDILSWNDPTGNNGGGEEDKETDPGGDVVIFFLGKLLGMPRLDQ